MTRRADGPPGPPPQPDLKPDPQSEPTPETAPPPAPESHQSSGAVPPADIIPGILPAGEVHLLSGASGVGKTAFVADLVSRVVHGQSVLGDIFVGRPPSFVGFIAADRAWKDHQQWFDLVGLPGIAHYSLINDLVGVTGKKLRSRTRADRFDLFCSSIDKLCGGAPPYDSLIIVDPISLFLGGNLIDYDKVYSYMVDMSQHCIRYGITVLGLCHTSKQKGDAKQRYSRPQDRIHGTTAQTGCAGTVFHLAPPSEVDKPWYELTWVPHHAPSETIKLKRGDWGLFDNYEPTEEDDEVAKAESAFGSGKRGLRLYKIYELIPADGSEIPTAELVEKIQALLEVKRAMAYRYLNQLVSRREVVEGTQPNTVRRASKN